MTESAHDSLRTSKQLLIVGALFAIGYVCLRNLRFTYAPLNGIFFILFLLIPWLAVRPLLKMPRWPKFLGAIFLTPLLSLAMLLLVFQLACGDFGRHPELVRDLGTITQGQCSVHLVRDGTAGALGPHGLSLEQRISIVPGLYLVKHLDWFEGAYEGSLSSEPGEKVRVHITSVMNGYQRVDRVYALKPRGYF